MSKTPTLLDAASGLDLAEDVCNRRGVEIDAPIAGQVPSAAAIGARGPSGHRTIFRSAKR